MADSTLSRPTLDPSYRRLGVAIVLNAAKDLTSPDPIRALDALAWLLFGGSEIYEGLEIDPERGALAILRTIQKSGGEHEKKYRKLTRLIG